MRGLEIMSDCTVEMEVGDHCLGITYKSHVNLTVPPPHVPADTAGFIPVRHPHSCKNI